MDFSFSALVTTLLDWLTLLSAAALIAAVAIQQRVSFVLLLGVATATFGTVVLAAVSGAPAVQMYVVYVMVLFAFIFARIQPRRPVR